MVNTMTALKASATPIAYSELYTSLQSGVVDGAENDVINYMANSCLLYTSPAVNRKILAGHIAGA